MGLNLIGKLIEEAEASGVNVDQFRIALGALMLRERVVDRGVESEELAEVEAEYTKMRAKKKTKNAEYTGEEMFTAFNIGGFDEIMPFDFLDKAGRPYTRVSKQLLKDIKSIFLHMDPPDDDDEPMDDDLSDYDDDEDGSEDGGEEVEEDCLLYTSPRPREPSTTRMPTFA